MHASRGCGVEGSSCTRTPPESPIPENTKPQKASAFVPEPIVQAFLVRLPASLLQAAVPARRLDPKTRFPRSDQGA